MGQSTQPPEPGGSRASLQRSSGDFTAFFKKMLILVLQILIKSAFFKDRLNVLMRPPGLRHGARAPISPSLPCHNTDYTFLQININHIIRLIFSKTQTAKIFDIPHIFLHVCQCHLH